MWMHLIVVTAIFVVSLLPQCCSAGTTNIFDGRISKGEVGWGYANRFLVPSREETVSKLRSFRGLGRAVTVQEFIGEDIQSIWISFYADPLDSFARARALLGSILASVIVSPEHKGEPGLRGPEWSEGSQDTIRAVVMFNDGHIGRIACDATDDGSPRAGGVHLFLEDHDGTYWWHRWDAFSPLTEVQPSAANDPVQRTGASRSAGSTNRLPGAAGSRR